MQSPRLGWTGIRGTVTAMALVALLLGLAAGTAWAGDWIKLKETDDNGNPKYIRKIQITKLARDRISYNVGAGSDTSKSTSEILGFFVDPDDRHKEYRNGLAAIKRTAFAEAIAAFKKCVAATRRVEAIDKHLALYQIVIVGVKLQNRQGATDAIWAAAKLRQDFGDSYYLPDVLENLGAAQEQLGNRAAAIKTFADLKRIAPARGAFRLAFARYSQTPPKYDKALADFEEALKQAERDGDTETAVRCNTFIARCALRLGRYARAAEVARKVIKANRGPDSLAPAYLVLGACQAKDRNWSKAFDSLAKAATAFKSGLVFSEQRLALGWTGRVAGERGAKDPAWAGRAEALKAKFTRRFRERELPKWPWEK